MSVNTSAELSVYVATAALVADIIVKPLPEETEYFGVHVRDLPDGQQVWVVRMIFSWRILETFPDSKFYGRFWCYAGRDVYAFLNAITHANLYGDGEPDGWVKAWR